jgi:multidrug transporter EmrE-like cation transporter
MLPTIILVVFSQLVSKWRVGILAKSMDQTPDRWMKLYVYLSDPYIVSAYSAALLGSFTWIFVIARYPISLAFPVYIGLTVLCVMVGGIVFFHESFAFNKLLAAIFILAGVVLASYSQP